MRISDWSSDVCSSDLCGLCNDRLSTFELLRGIRMPREQARTRWPDDLVKRTVVAQGVPAAEPNMLVILRDWNLCKAAGVTMQKRDCWETGGQSVVGGRRGSVRVEVGGCGKSKDNKTTYSSEKRH